MIVCLGTRLAGRLLSTHADCAITSFRAENFYWPAGMELMMLSATLTSVEDVPASNDSDCDSEESNSILPYLRQVK
jgi:hypothetical protein